MSQRIPLPRLPSTKSPPLAAIMSLFIPGLGQIYLGSAIAGIAIFITTALLAFLVNWALDTFNIGKVEFGGLTTSWLWLLIAGLWLWNVRDVYLRASGRRASSVPGFAFAVLLIYVIAWQVTDVNLVRLVTRFNDVKIIFNALIHPDFFTRDTVQQAGSTTLSIPCSNPPLAKPPGDAGYPVQLDRICATVEDTVTFRGQGFIPGTTGKVYWLEYGGTNEVQVRQENEPVQMTADANGAFSVQFKVPSFAGREGLDPAAPTTQAVEARFVQEVGPYKPSENFGELIGKIDNRPAPGWMVNLGLVAPEATIPMPIPGKIFETIALGLMATLASIVVAAPLSFFAAHNIMARVRGGSIIYYIARALFNITRSIDTLIWALIFVGWVGLGAFTGLLALSLHSIAALAKLYSEEVEHIDPGPVEATTATGANLFQNIRFAVLPQIVPPFLAFSLLRWDINMRSATVVGLVSAAGIGFYIIEAIRKGGYEQYAAALWLVAIVVMIVDYVSSYWREQILRGDSRVSAEPPKPFYRTRRGILYLILFVLVFVASWNLSQIDLSKLLSPGANFGKLVADFITIDTTSDVWQAILKALLVTVFQALLATTLGGLIAVPFSFFAARNIVGRSRATVWIYYIARLILNFLRSIEALLYVAIFVFWVGIGSFAGMLALSITTFGLIGKLFSEAIENIEEGPVEAITATGANRLQSIVYAVAPQIIPPFVSYAIYQWDINIRIATIIGFAGGGGIGLLFSNYTGQLQYHKAGAVILSIVVVVTLMDFASAKIRERLV